MQGADDVYRFVNNNSAKMETIEKQTFHRREFQDVERVMGLAKLDQADLKPCVQSLHFVDNMDNDVVKLIEVSKDIVECLQEGDSIVIRGDKTESAVLCTENKTFDMKEQETSNLLLLVPDLVNASELAAEGSTHNVDREIVSVHQKYYELREMKPRLKKLQMLLEENQFSGLECEDDEDHQGAKYKFTDILERVQASEKEIEAHLKHLGACEMNGHWRLLDFDFQSSVLDHILKLQEEEGWPWHQIPITQCCEVLRELFPRHMVQHVLLSFADNQSEHTDGFCKLSEDKICRFFAEMILRPVGQFNFEEFQRVWQQSVPEGLKTGLYQLEGVALIDRETKPEVIRYYHVNSLPEETAERFQILFQTKEKWTTDEILPYISDLATEKIKTSALLTKHARASTQNGIKLYNSKKPIS